MSINGETISAQRWHEDRSCDLLKLIADSWRQCLSATS
jgi:hypothetical protein